MIDRSVMMPEGGANVIGSLSPKKWDSRATKNQTTSTRQQKCCSLEPVLEHSVDEVSYCRKQGRPQRGGDESNLGLGVKLRKGNIMTRLRDRYVRLMNDMASGADMTGVSAAYWYSAGPVDYPGSPTAMDFARRAKVEEEMVAVKLAATPNSPKSI